MIPIRINIKYTDLNHRFGNTETANSFGQRLRDVRNPFPSPPDHPTMATDSPHHHLYLNTNAPAPCTMERNLPSPSSDLPHHRIASDGLRAEPRVEDNQYEVKVTHAQNKRSPVFAAGDFCLDIPFLKLGSLG